MIDVVYIFFLLSFGIVVITSFILLLASEDVSSAKAGGIASVISTLIFIGGINMIDNHRRECYTERRSITVEGISGASETTVKICRTREKFNGEFGEWKVQK